VIAPDDDGVANGSPNVKGQPDRCATLCPVVASSSYAALTVVPRIALRLPIALPEPDGFAAEQSQTWPEVTGRLEYVAGRLEYMPPCGEVQQRVAVDVVTELNLWRRKHPEWAVGGNEAGMFLGGEVRAADAAIWRADPRPTDGFARTAPVLAVEVAGGDDAQDALREKALWYLARGVETVWLVLPESRSVEIVTTAGRVEVRTGGLMLAPASLPDLRPRVADFFRQLP
jgi:Uma2 family endonuclease